MFSVSRVLMGFGALLTTGGIGFLAAYETTKKTVSDGLDGKRIIFGNSESSQMAWGKLAKKMRESREKKNPKSSLFKSLDISSFDETNYSGLKNICIKANSQIYSTLISSDETLLEDVKDFCTITIREVFSDLDALFLKTKEKEREGDKEIFRKNLNTLKNHDENQYGKLVEDLETLKTKFSKNIDSDDGWKQLADWCDRSYDLTFLNEEESLVKQINVYCQRAGEPPLPSR